MAPGRRIDVRTGRQGGGRTVGLRLVLPPTAQSWGDQPCGLGNPWDAPKHAPVDNSAGLADLGLPDSATHR